VSQARQVQHYHLRQGSRHRRHRRGPDEPGGFGAIAARKAQDAATELKLAEPLTKGSVVASDAFFPFADGMLACIEAGATAVIQPGGSMRDDEVIKAADEHGIAMVFTGMRHFRHCILRARHATRSEPSRKIDVSATRIPGMRRRSR
jgi:hypothetical protein